MGTDELPGGGATSGASGRIGAAAAPQRVHALDNLRGLTVLALFVIHTCMIYNTFGEPFYIHGADLPAASGVIVFLNVWMMPLLFAIAGAGTALSLRRRSAGEYVKDRLRRLLAPLVFGLLLIVPAQAWIASAAHGGAGRGDLARYFTTLTDFSGYDGAFTPGHLWFLLYLLVISLVSLPFLWAYSKRTKPMPIAARTPLPVLIALAALPPIMNPVLDIGGKSLGEFATYFLLGFFFLSRREVMARLAKYRFPLLGLTVCAAALSIAHGYTWFEACSWLAVMTAVGLGRHYLNFTGRITGYISRSSFGVYLFHQTWIVVLAFLIFRITDNCLVQIPLILASSVALTYLTYETLRRFRATRLMFGLR